MSVIPLWGTQTYPGTTVHGPVVMKDLQQFPVLTAQIPSTYSKSMESCVHVSVEGPNKCNDLTAWTYEYLEDCTLVFGECDDKQERSILANEDSGTDDLDGLGDSAGETQEDADAGDHEDSFVDGEDNEYDSSEDDNSKESSAEDYFKDAPNDASEEPKEYDFEAFQEDGSEAPKEYSFEGVKDDKEQESNECNVEESEEHDPEDSKWADFTDSVKDDSEDTEEQDYEGTDEHGFEDADEHDSEDQEYGSASSEPAFGYSSSTPAFDYPSSIPAEKSFTFFPPVVTKVFKVARQLSSGIPQSVQDALISDSNAPRSLAAQFTDGADTPDWYDNLPEQQQEMFLTERAPQMGTTTMTMVSGGQSITATMSTSGVMTTAATTVTPAPTIDNDDFICDNPNNNVTQACIELAVSSQVADHFSRIATDMSQAAESLTCSTLSSAASDVSEGAASAQTMASAARSSLGCDQIEDNAADVDEKGSIIIGAASPAFSVPKSSAVFAVSLTVAVATLGLALYL